MVNESVYGTHVRVKMDAKPLSENGCKIWPITKKSKNGLFSAPGDAQGSTNGTTTRSPSTTSVRFFLSQLLMMNMRNQG